MADRYSVIMEFTEQLLGTVPKNKEIYGDFIESKARERVDFPPEPMLPSSEIDTVTEDLEAKGWTGFHQDPRTKDLLVYDYFVKGFIKNAGNVLKGSLSEFCQKKSDGGFANLKSHLNNYVFVRPRCIPIVDHDGKSITKPDGVFERPLRAYTAQGPRVSLVKSDLIEAGRQLRFSLVVVEGHPFKHQDELFRRLLGYAEFQGFGQFRNGGFGSARCVEFKIQT